MHLGRKQIDSKPARLRGAVWPIRMGAARGEIVRQRAVYGWRKPVRYTEYCGRIEWMGAVFEARGRRRKDVMKGLRAQTVAAVLYRRVGW